MIVSVWDLVTYVRNKVGCGYVWGASGETCSLSLRQRLAERAPAQKARILGTCAKWDGVQVFDCATLIREAFKAAGIKKGSGTTTIWRTWPFIEKGTIDTLPMGEPGIALFVSEGSDKMAHIGMTIGGGLAVDCRGSVDGVLLGPVSGHKWTHWARFADVNYEAVRPDLPAILPGVVATKSGTLSVRARPDTKAQVLGKLPKGEALAVLKDGQTLADWLKVYYAGGVAYVMAKYVSMGVALPPQPATNEPADPPPQAPLELRTLRYTPGLPIMRGEDVIALQNRFQSLGHNPGVVDGVYGPKTKAAVIAFQLDAFPTQTKEWDGIVGAKTWAKLKD